MKGYGKKYEKVFKTLGLVALNAKNFGEAIGAGKNELEDSGIYMDDKEVKHC